MKRKLLALLLALAMIFTGIPLSITSPMLVQAATSDFSFDQANGTITGYTGSETDITIPEQIDGVQVKGIGKQAFRNKELTSVEIPSTVEEINYGAFINNKLTSVEVPASVRILDEYAFALNPELSQVNLNEGLESIEGNAFMGISSLKEIDIPSTVNYIGTSSFKNGALERMNVKGDENSAHLVIRENISPNFEEIFTTNPKKKISVNYSAFKDHGTNTIDLGQLDLSLSSQTELQSWIDENINIIFRETSKVNIQDLSGRSDSFSELNISWDLSQFNPSQPYIVTGVMDPGDADASSFPATNQIILKVNPQPGQDDQAYPPVDWQTDDFTYQIQEHKGINETPREVLTITGFSPAGKEKISRNPNLVIPKIVNYQGQERLVDMVGKQAFAGEKIKSVSFPETAGETDFTIDYSAFENSGLERVEFKDGVKYIESMSFKNNNLEKIVIPQTVLRIGNSAFLGNNIKSLEISDLVEEIQIDNYSFQGNQLREVDLPYSVFKIQDHVFKDNPVQVKLDTRNKEHLMSGTYIVPESESHKIILVSPGVDRQALWQELSLVDDIPLQDYSQEAIGKFLVRVDEVMATFSNNQASQDQIDQAKADLIQAKEDLIASAPGKSGLRDLISQAEAVDERMVDPATYEDLSGSLDQARKILVGPASQEEISQAEDRLRSSLVSLRISEDAQYKKEDFIYDGHTITGFSLSGEEKFAYNKDLVLPDTSTEGLIIKEIADSAFEAPEDLVEFGTDISNTPEGIRTVKLPAELEKIGNSAFRYQNIQELNLPETVTSIGGLAFNGNKIKELYLPDYTLDLGVGAFSLNTISKLRIPPAIEEINRGVFSRNYDLETLVIPEGVTKIGDGAFWGARISQLSLPESLEEIGSNAFNSHRLESLKLPDNLKTIGEAAFKQNPKWMRLKELELGQDLKSVGRRAFGNSLLDQVNLPYGLEELAKDAFKGNIDEFKNPKRVKLYTTNSAHANFDMDDSAEIIVLEDLPDPGPGQDDVPSDPSEDDKPSDPGQPDRPSIREDEVKKDDQTPEQPDKKDPTIQEQLEVQRLAGQDRYETSIIISQTYYPSAQTVVLATGEDFPDSLAAAALAHSKEAPLLLTADHKVQDVTQEIKRLGAKEIIIVGGTSSVSLVEEEAYGQIAKIERIYGQDRYQTALQIAERILQAKPGQNTVIVADGRNFADALAIAPYSAQAQIPIILADGSGLPGADSLLADYGISKAIVVGGPSSVGDLSAYFDQIERIAGSNRYETAVRIAEKFYPNADEIFLASGQVYADALSVGALAGREKAPIFLAPASGPDKTLSTYLQNKDFDTLTIIGGYSSINKLDCEE